jgi:hypothetical protein
LGKDHKEFKRTNKTGNLQRMRFQHVPDLSSGINGEVPSGPFGKMI